MRLPHLSSACVALAISGCGGARETPAVGPVTVRSAPIHFSYPSVDGKGEVGSRSLSGRPTVIAFVATYDLASQAQARFLSIVKHRHEPRVNVAAIALEPVENRPLIVAFRDALRLDYPVAMGDSELISGGGPFGDVRVPTTVVLDAEGRIAWKRVGLAKDSEIDQAIRTSR
jgi:hypothetical protein